MVSGFDFPLNQSSESKNLAVVKVIVEAEQAASNMKTPSVDLSVALTANTVRMPFMYYVCATKY